MNLSFTYKNTQASNRETIYTVSENAIKNNHTRKHLKYIEVGPKMSKLPNYQQIVYIVLNIANEIAFVRQFRLASTHHNTTRWY